MHTCTWYAYYCAHIRQKCDMLTHILVARLKLLYKQMQGLLDVYTAFFPQMKISTA